jgi:hypothetical protein
MKKGGRRGKRRKRRSKNKKELPHTMVGKFQAEKRRLPSKI